MVRTGTPATAYLRHYHRAMDLSGPREAVDALIEDEDLSPALRRLMAVTEASFERSAQLDHALKSRIVIEQAKGMLAERFRVAPGEAFELLRGTARFRQITVLELARAVVADKDTPAPILAYIQKSLTE